MSKGAISPAQVVDFCLSLPGAREDYKWGGVRVFSIAGNKMFAVLDLAGAGLSFKVDSELFLGYVDRPGVRPAPYLARAHWISLAPPTQWLARSSATCCSAPTNWWSGACPNACSRACLSEQRAQGAAQPTTTEQQVVDPEQLVHGNNGPETQLKRQLSGFVPKGLLGQ